VTGIEPALSAWEAASVLRSATPVGACDQEIRHFGSAALPLWVEIWVENRCGRESVKADAAHCCSLIPDAGHPVARCGGISPRCSHSEYGPQAKQARRPRRIQVLPCCRAKLISQNLEPATSAHFPPSEVSAVSGRPGVGAGRVGWAQGVTTSLRGGPVLRRSQVWLISPSRVCSRSKMNFPSVA
jgi:hypothetical protein